MHSCYPQYKQKGFTPIIILVGILVIVAIAGGAYYFAKSQSVKPETTSFPNSVQTTQSPQSTSVSQSTSTPSADETANWKSYTDQTYNYSFKYPPQYIKPYGNLEIPQKPRNVIALEILPYNSSDSQNEIYYSYEDFGTKLALGFCAAGGYSGESYCDSVHKSIPLTNKYGIEALKLYLNGTTTYFGKIQKSVVGPWFVVNITAKSSKSQTVLYITGDENLFDQIFSTFKFTQ